MRRFRLNPLIALAALLFTATILAPQPVLAAELESFDVSSAAPRPVEETTALALQRDYARAWKSLSLALSENQPSALDENFTGAALEHWKQAVAGQRQNGLSRKIIDRGHRMRVTFYSLDGSAIEADDTASLEIQYLDGATVLSTERVDAHYLVLFTPSENSWRVRVLQETAAR